eukprot:TRINITY_DN8141_c0_g1_i1.p1 TRINITY_DN8141_c0_g1~~TRINITY_DN8141_c0_g1_i1.p1  ORF type:complete len:484 (+),score=80.76 TRINITY_DN8141_c0_g1_i1:63-1514(+)
MSPPVRWDLIAYLLRYSMPLLEGNHKTEASRFLPYLSLSLLRQEGEFFTRKPPPYYQMSAWDWEEAEARAKDPVLVLDVGAYDGEFSLKLLQTVALMEEPARSKPSNSSINFQVVAIEPNPSAWLDLNRRVNESGLANSYCMLNMVMSSEPAESVPFGRIDTLGDYKSGRMSARLLHDGEKWEGMTVQVEQKTVDQLFEEASCGLHGKREVFLMKIDCEGHDGKVLLGSENLLRSGRVKYLIFEHVSGANEMQLDDIMEKLWNYGYGCFLILDRFLTPLSYGWLHPLYRDRSRGGMTSNVDIFCAHPQDSDLTAVIEGFVTHSIAKKAKEIAYAALAEWKKQKPLPSRSVHELYNVQRIEDWPNFDPIMKDFFLGDLLRTGYGARPNAKERRLAMQKFRRAVAQGRDKKLLEAGQWAVGEATLELGICYHFGECGPRNLELARYWYQMSIDRTGHMLAVHLLALLRLDIERVSRANGTEIDLT